MEEHQISVSLDGKFLFRTEWDDDKERVMTAANTLKGSLTFIFGDVVVYTRTKIMTRVII